MARKASKSSDVAELANKAIAKRLRELATDTAALAKHLDCSIQAVNQYKQGTSQPKIENIIKIAEFYNVSIDYLFGITETKNRDTTVQAICQETGLSEKAVEKIQDINRSGDNLTEALTFLIEHREFLRLLYCIRDLKNPEIFKLDDRAGLDYIYRVVHDLQSPKIDAIGSVQYRGSRTFGNIMEDALKQNVGNQKKEG